MCRPLRVESKPDALDGRATYRRMRVTIPTPQDGKPFTFEYSLFIPKNTVSKPAVFLLLNNRPVRAADPTRQEKSEFWPVEAIIEKGYATAVLQLTAVQPDKNDGLSSSLVAACPVREDDALLGPMKSAPKPSQPASFGNGLNMATPRRSQPSGC